VRGLKVQIELFTLEANLSKKKEVLSRALDISKAVCDRETERQINADISVTNDLILKQSRNVITLIKSFPLL
jgi:hypothetical protein